jgi:hypothetical protein
LDLHKCLIFYEYKAVSIVCALWKLSWKARCELWFLIVYSAEVWIHELFLFKALCMQVGTFWDEFSEKGLAICGLPKRSSAERPLNSCSYWWSELWCVCTLSFGYSWFRLFRPLNSIWLILLQKQKHLQPYPSLLLLEFPMKCLCRKSSSRSWMKTNLSFEWQKA